MALAPLLLFAYTQSSCSTCTETHTCLVERIGNVECITLEDAQSFGGCGTTGFFNVHGEEVAFSSEDCTTTTTTSTSTVPQEEKSPSSSRKLKTGEIVAITVGSVAVFATAIAISLLIGQRTKGKYSSIARAPKVFV